VNTRLASILCFALSSATTLEMNASVANVCFLSVSFAVGQTIWFGFFDETATELGHEISIRHGVLIDAFDERVKVRAAVAAGKHDDQAEALVGRLGRVADEEVALLG
jgi:hypothetical protein